MDRCGPWLGCSARRIARPGSSSSRRRSDVAAVFVCTGSRCLVCVGVDVKVGWARSTRLNGAEFPSQPELGGAFYSAAQYVLMLVAASNLLRYL